jgi:hypothetical protein
MKFTSLGHNYVMFKIVYKASDYIDFSLDSRQLKTNFKKYEFFPFTI